MQATVESAPHPRGCTVRSLALQIETPELFAGLGLSPAQVLVRAAPGGEVLSTQSLDFAGKPTSIDIPARGVDVLLVQVSQAGFLFDSLIVQFLPDCSRNQTTIFYQPTEQEQSQIRSTLELLSDDAPTRLALNWWIEAWGPAPFWNGWVAVVAFEGQGGRGDYVYWSHTDPANPLPEGRLVITNDGCQRGYLQIGVTSGGESASQIISLLSPYCATVPTPPPPPTPTLGAGGAAPTPTP
jgi:hypothetical protein